jgi:hypothetical protein
LQRRDGGNASAYVILVDGVELKRSRSVIGLRQAFSPLFQEVGEFAGQLVPSVSLPALLLFPAVRHDILHFYARVLAVLFAREFCSFVRGLSPLGKKRWPR